MKKLLGFVIAVSVHQCHESDILSIVELAVKRAVAESFVKSFATGCRIKPQQLRYSNVNLLYHIREN
jgi:hypothetical protein